MNIIQSTFKKIKSFFIKDTLEPNSPTSTNALSRVKNDKKLRKYKVIEVTSATKARAKHTMDYYMAGKGHHPVPGMVNTNILGQNCTTMVPQGVCRMEDYLLITAYDSEGNNNSVIYVMDDKDGGLVATLVYNRKCHMGGIAYDGRYIWIAEGSKSGLGAISKDNMLETIKLATEKNGKSVQLENIIWQRVKELDGTSYLTFYDDRLWIGEFDKNKESHIYGYSVDYSGGEPKITAERYIEAPKRAQGICFHEMHGVKSLGVSISYGRHNNSIMGFYDLVDYMEPTKREDGILVINKKEYKSLIMPSMLEQISVDGDKMYCIYESCARKYLMNMDGYGYSRRPIGSCVAFDVNKIFDKETR